MLHVRDPARLIAFRVPRTVHYQGWTGLLLTILLAALYLTTGSLLLPIVFHVAVDVRGLLLTPPPA